MVSPPRRMGIRRKFLFSALTLLLFTLVAEIALRCVHFQLTSSTPLAIVSAFRASRGVASRWKTNQELDRFRDVFAPTWHALFSEDGAVVLAEFQGEYRAHFARLADACQRQQSALVVLYIPSFDADNPKNISEPICRQFFRDLCEEHDVPFVDVTESLREHDWLDVTLMPEDGHLSRFGHRIVARELASRLAGFEQPGTLLEYNGHPGRCGDLAPGRDEIWNMNPRIPFRVVTNRQGFRNADDVAIPKRRQRVLLLGDSYTFGPYLANHDTLAAWLERESPEREVLNAGVVGYTILQEVELFFDRARHVAPDVTVLQVVDNDLYGFFHFKKNQFSRDGRKWKPTTSQIELYRTIGLEKLIE